VKRTVLTVAVVACTASLSACSFSFGGTLSADDVEDAIVEEFDPLVGVDSQEVSCDDIDAEEGATGACTVTYGEEEYDVDVEVTEVDGADSRFEMTPPEEIPGYATADSIADLVNGRLTELVGYAPDDLTCPYDVPGVVGATTVCTLTDDGVELDVDVEITAVEGQTFSLDIEVAEQPND